MVVEHGKVLVNGLNLAYSILGPVKTGPSSQAHGSAAGSLSGAAVRADRCRTPAVLLIMGMGTARWAWDRQVAAFARHFLTITYDHRGIGESDRPFPDAELPTAGSVATATVPYGIKELASDALGLLDALGIARAHIVGISMGGFIAQTLAIEHPERVGRLILGATTCGGPDAVLPDPGVWWDSLRIGEMAPDAALRTMLRTYFGPSFAVEQPRLAALLSRRYLEHPEPRETLMAQANACIRFDESARVGRISAPTLVVHGTADVLLPVENARVLASRIPGARLILYPGAGHGFVIERAEEFNRDAVEFMLGRA